MENQFLLVASIIERDTIRYTPVGIPVITATLKHSSTQVEAEAPRLVEFEISAIAIGKIVGRFDKLELGQINCFTGFIATKTKKSKSLIFHITDFKEHIIDTGA